MSAGSRRERPGLPAAGLWLALLPALSACGGIEGTGSPIAAIEGTGISDGGVSGFGSVFVNGVRYETGRADILIDGVPADESALRVGMVVRVNGEVDDGAQGSARRIEFDRPLFGPIDVIDREARIVTLLGQPVRLDDATLLDNRREEDLQPGQLCLVSGYPESDGRLLASLLQCADGYEPGVTPVEVEGLVRDLDSGAGRLRIGSLDVDLRQAMLDTTAGALANQALVEVVGRQPQRAGVLIAERIRVKSARLAPAQAVVIEGVIGRFDGLQDFELSRQRVDASGAQRDDTFGIAPASGQRIRVQGIVGADGRITASRFALLPLTNVLMTARIDAVDADNQRLTLFAGQSQALTTTQFEDTRSNGRRAFRLRDLQPDDYVQLRGFRDTQGRMVVTRVERRTEEEPASGTVVARFRVGVGAEPDPLLAQVRGLNESSDVVSGLLVIAGVTVMTDNTRTEFFDRNGSPTTGPLFFNGLQAGDRLEAEGNESSDLVQATRVRYAR